MAVLECLSILMDWLAKICVPVHDLPTPSPKISLLFHRCVARWLPVGVLPCCSWNGYGVSLAANPHDCRLPPVTCGHHVVLAARLMWERAVLLSLHVNMMSTLLLALK